MEAKQALPVDVDEHLWLFKWEGDVPEHNTPHQNLAEGYVLVEAIETHNDVVVGVWTPASGVPCPMFETVPAE